MLVKKYVEAFQRCYPQTKLDVKTKTSRNTGQMVFYVGINGDYGDRPLSESDMRFAIQNFNRPH